MDVDRDAPAYAEGRIEVDAPRQLVWDVLVAFADWPSWNTGVTSVEYAGPLEPGALFRWKSGPGTIRSRVEEVDAPRAIAWRGKTFGIKAEHAWQLDDADGKTVVATQEGWRGLVVRFLRHSIRPTLQRSIDEGLEALKVEAERRAASTA
jgi:hypothetical protein